MIISTPQCRVSIARDEPAAMLEAVKLRERVMWEHEIGAPRCAETMNPARAVVEILRYSGGLMPRALIGGTLTPSPGLNLAIQLSQPAQVWTGTLRARVSCGGR